MSDIDEPILHGDEIQGDSLAGFRKDHATLLFLEFDVAQIEHARRWLGSLTLATLTSVHAFNVAFSAMRRHMNADPPLNACWMNIGFTADGLRKLMAPAEVAKLGVAFNLGAHGRSSFVGDPSNGSPGDARTWRIGGPGNVPDAMVIVAADREEDVASQVSLIRRDLSALVPGGSPVRIMYEQVGQTRPGAMSGHEHFGFKDGISQPGIRGRLDGQTHPLLTPRFIDPADPLGDLFAAPGQPLLWPGEFVLGYPGMDQDDPLKPAPVPAGPLWMTDGSFLVFRRLQQDVDAFESFVRAGVEKLTAEGFSMTPERFGAMCVGRWASGTPILRAPQTDDRRFAKSPNDAMNSFFFAQDTVPVIWKRSIHRKPDHLPPAQRDFDGVTCPLGAHIRKVNPRDEATDQGDFPRTLQHRIIRRGIPYGTEHDPTRPGSDREDRGLLFLAYQSSIEGQFEFLQRAWANSANAPRTDGGIDPIIGLAGNNEPSTRMIRFVDDRDKAVEVLEGERLVIATGGAYLFVPSISTVRDILGKPARHAGAPTAPPGR